MLLDDFSECTREAKQIEDAKLGRALKAKEGTKARGMLGAPETSAQKAKKAAEKERKRRQRPSSCKPTARVHRQSDKHQCQLQSAWFMMDAGSKDANSVTEEGAETKTSAKTRTADLLTKRQTG